MDFDSAGRRSGNADLQQGKNTRLTICARLRMDKNETST